MEKKCDIHFTLEEKQKRFLIAAMRVYKVPETEQKEVLEYISGLDVKRIANEVVAELFSMLEMKFDFKLQEEPATVGA